MTREEHIARHKLLHHYFDELIADWITRTGNRPSEATVRDLIEWSYEQTINPSEVNMSASGKEPAL